MSYSSADFHTALAVGLEGEDLIHQWLARRGWVVMPAHDVVGGSPRGPRVKTAKGALIAPDLIAVRNGAALWCEVKTKSQFSWNRVNEEWRTGIDARLFSQYRAVGEESGAPVWLLFWHPEPSHDELAPCVVEPGLYAIEINEAERTAVRGIGAGSKMLYWTPDDLTRIASVEDVTS